MSTENAPRENEERGEPVEKGAPEERGEAPEGETPPRGTRAMGIARWGIVVVSALVALGSWLSFAHAQHVHDSATNHAAKYQCPMHPEIVSDEPGECPICHMTLEPIAPERASDAGADGGDDRRAPVGTAPLTLALDRVQAIGVRTAVARVEAVNAPLRVTAVVMAADQGMAEVHVRAPGFVERLDANQMGVSVAKGQLLFLLYSPEIFQAETELAVARQWGGAPGAGDGGTSGALVRARKKLELLGMAPEDVDKVVETGEPIRAIGVRAPQRGYVAKKNVVAGSYVTPEMTLYEIQDLSRVYVVADVLSRDVGSVKVGALGRFVHAGAEGAIDAKVDLVYPVLNAEARTTRVRMQMNNEKGALMPGQYGSVEFSLSTRAALTVPRDAIVDTGTTTYVFVVEGEGRFAPRTVSVSGTTGDLAVVAGGISAGERVVSGATFLLDSESRLRAGIAGAVGK